MTPLMIVALLYFIIGFSFAGAIVILYANENFPEWKELYIGIPVCIFLWPILVAAKFL